MKKSIKLAVILILLVLLAACGGQPAVEEAAPAAESEPAEEAAQDEAVADETSAPVQEASAEATEEMTEEASEDGETAAAVAGFPRTITDGSGVELTFEEPPERIVCVDNACVEIFAFLDVMPTAVGEFYNYNILVDPANFGEAAIDVPQVPSDSDGNPNFEMLAELEPDLVVGWNELRPAVSEFSTLYTLYYSGDSLDDFTVDVRMMAQILGIEDEAEAKIAAALERFEAYRVLAPDNVTLFQTGIDGDRPVFYNYDPNSFGDCGVLELIAICAYQAAIEGSMSLEALLNVDPDFIIIEEYDPANGAAAAQVQGFAENEALWPELSAYQDDRIFTIPRTRARPATLQSALSFLDTVAPLLYPDIFDGPLTDEQVQEIVGGEAATSAEGFPVTVTDASGNEVTLDAPPERILCLLPDCIQHLAVIDVLPAMVFEFDKTSASSPGVFGERAEEMASFAWGDSGPDPEVLLDFAPDFFVLQTEALEWSPPLATVIETIPSYNSAGPYPDTTQWDINDPETWSTFTADLRNFGVMLGREEQANAFIERLEDRVAAYTKLADPSVEYARVRLETDNSIFAPPCMGLTSEMATCVSFGDDWVQTTVEALLDADPDVIFVEASPDREIELEAWMDVPLWAELSAVKNNRVHVVPYDAFYDATPLALSNTLDAMLPHLNPEAFPDGPLTDEEVQEILAGTS